MLWITESSNRETSRPWTAGSWPVPPEGHGFVQLFVQVDDLPRRMAKAQELGAKVLIPPQALPDGDELTILLDPEGIAFGMMRRGSAARD